MTLATADFVEKLASLTGTAPHIAARVLWGVLLAGLFGATVQLFTMLVTRWGDRDPTLKSLIFSLLVHISCLFGLVAMSPPVALSKPDDAEQRTNVRATLADSDERVPRRQSGSTPVLEKLPEPIEQQLARDDLLPRELKPLEAPERRRDPPTKPDLDLPDIPMRPDDPVARPEPREQARTMRRVESAVPLEITEPTAEARTEVSVPATSPIRRPVERSGQRDQPTVERDPNRGAVERVRPDFNATPQIAAMETRPNTPTFLKRGRDADVIRRRSGPAPAPLPTDTAGTVAKAETTDAAAGSPGPTRFTRQATRVPRAQTEGGTERFRTDQIATTPRPRSEPIVAVRDGVLSPQPRPGLSPNIVRPNVTAPRRRRTANVPATYRLRTRAQRREAARTFGGTDASERAVEASLEWLTLHQHAEGNWDADGFTIHCPTGDQCAGWAGRVGVDEEGIDRQHAGRNADAGLTALAMLAFLGAGYTHEEGTYAEPIDRALAWLIRQQRADGYLGGQATYFERMYCHAMATYALAEAYGMQTDPTTAQRLRIPLQRAVRFILDQQNPTDGGWRYRHGQPGDMSMFGWQLMALKSAEIGGIPMPRDTRERMDRFLQAHSQGEYGGLAVYRITDPPLPPSPAMTAEALFCKQMLGIERTNPASVEASQYLLQHLPKQSQLNLYYWYYGTLSMYQYGGKPWRTWNESLRDVLVDTQRTTGHAAGSWDPIGLWDPYGGRIYATALSTLCLEVYYRFLPLYNMGGRYAESE